MGKQAPGLAVGQDAPGKFSVRVVVDFVKVANQLSGCIAGIQRVVLDRIVERSAPILGFRDSLGSQIIGFRFVGCAAGVFVCFLVGEEGIVRADFLCTPSVPRLRVVQPAQGLQDRTNELVLGLLLVRTWNRFGWSDLIGC